MLRCNLPAARHFSDGAGTFVAEWTVTEGRAFRTIITDDSGIFELFEKNIDGEER